MRTREQVRAAYVGLRVAVVAEALDCSVEHVHALIRMGAFQGVIDIGTGRRPEYRIPRESFERFLDRRSVSA